MIYLPPNPGKMDKVVTGSDLPTILAANALSFSSDIAYLLNVKAIANAALEGGELIFTKFLHSPLNATKDWKAICRRCVMHISMLIEVRGAYILYTTRVTQQQPDLTAKRAVQFLSFLFFFVFIAAKQSCMSEQQRVLVSNLNPLSLNREP